MSSRFAARIALLAALLFARAGVVSADAPAGGAAHTKASLLAQAKASEEALRSSVFGRAMTIRSSDADNTLHGEVLVEMEQPFEQVRTTFSDPRAWCDVLMLTPNFAACRNEGEGDAQKLSVRIGRKFDQAASAGYAATFAFHVRTSTPDYLFVELTADKGPAGTHDYILDVDALPLDAGRSLLRMTYSYGYGMTVKLATAAYLATSGSSKVGFTVESTGPDGKPVLVGGMRGSVERNAMRYELGIEARVSQPAGEPKAVYEHALDQYLAGIAKYPQQLAEEDVAKYRSVKLAQFGAAP